MLIGALAAHVSVNAFNEWWDFRSGLDGMTRRTPFSGGSGSLPARPELAPAALVIALLGLLACISIGLGFVASRGMALLPIGLAGVLLVVGYTCFVTRSPWFCLIAPGLAFGPLMVLGTELVLAGRMSMAGLLASLPGFFLVNGLLLLNQFPDVEPDRVVGRRSLPVAFGLRASARMFVALLALAVLSVVAAVFGGGLPSACLASLLSFGLAFRFVPMVLADCDSPERLQPAMALNVALTLAVPLLFGLGFLLTPY